MFRVENVVEYATIMYRTTFKEERQKRKDNRYVANRRMQERRDKK